MKLSKQILALATVGMATTMLANCGGDSHTYSESPGTVTLSGVAVKGVLSSATVVACLASSDECRNAPEASFTGSGSVSGQVGGVDTTDNNGEYSIDLGTSANGLPVLVRIFANSTTTTACDFTDCTGNQGELAGLELRTLELIESPTPGINTTETANLTALTTVAADTFTNTVTIPEGAVSASEFLNAQQQVSDSVAGLLGINVRNAGGTSNVNLFDVDIVTANANTLSSVQDQVTTTVPATADLIRELSIFNATFGVVARNSSNSIANVSTNVASIVRQRLDNTTLTPTDTAITTLSTQLDLINTEVTNKVTTLNSGSPSFTVPTLTPTTSTDLVNTANNLVPVIDTVIDGTTTTSSGASGGSGGSS